MVRRGGRLAKQGGNVIGYVCTPTGEVLHAIPEVPSPRRYLEELEWALALGASLASVEPDERAAWVGRAHTRSVRGSGALRADVHAYFARRPYPRIRDVEQELFKRLLNENWTPSTPITKIGSGYALCR